MQPRNKYKTKIGMYSTIDVDVFEKFIKLANEKSINRSDLITKFLKKWTEDNK